MAEGIQCPTYSIQETLMLFKEFFETCVRVVKVSTPDGEGGKLTKETDGAEFMAAIIMNTSNEATVAASERMERTYTITAPIGTNLAFYEEIKRLSDGQKFRVVSVPKDQTTPIRATFGFEQVQAVTVDE